MPVNVFDYRHLIAGGFHFCGTSEQPFMINGRRYQWPRKSRLSWNLAFDRLGSLNDGELKDANEFIFREISRVCELDFVYSVNPKTANILVSLDRLDGRSGTLADMQVPVGNVSVQSTQLRGRIDVAEMWGIFDGPGGGKIDYRRTQFHENLHALGLGHKPDSDRRKALIAATYSENLWLLQEADIEELVVRYGARDAVPLPPPKTDPVLPAGGFTHAIKVGVPDGGKVAIELNLGIGGKSYRATGNAIEVQAG